jgi:hypothetical protein
MNRRNWSNLLILLAAISVVLSFWPSYPGRLFCWGAAAICVFLSAAARRRMV